jgi:Tol biopolymer transport system component
MKADGRWPSVERLYNEALDRPREERAAFLEKACAGDEALRREVESLLDHGERPFLEEPALEVAAGAIGEERSLVGRRLGRYEVLSLVGAGGMGEVYRARDTTLGREVALKVLAREFSADPERLGRLEREARVLASLNHPGIATLHGVEQAEGQRVLVMELVTGATLAERLQRRPLPLAEALEVGRQMAEALEAAHERGVVHRDLKPANVKVTPEGRVKLLDFGLAKALEGTSSELATTPAEGATREGTVLGTPAYMSPEQARGQPVDRRADIWAFGCCLYESLVGRRAFGGDTTSDTLVAVLDREPDWGALPEATPEGTRRALRRCLTKDVRQRLQHIGDARLELQDTGAERSERSPPGRRRRLAPPSLVAAALLGALGAGMVGVLAWRSASGRRTAAPPDDRVTRLTLKLEGETARALRLSVHTFFVPFALSPDGTHLVFQARGVQGRQLFVRELSGFETRPLPGTERATTPFFSHDGRWVGFWRAEGHKLWKVAVSGGPPVEIGATDAPQTALWGADDEILLEGAAHLWSISSAGGQPRQILVGDRSEDERISLRSRIPGRSEILVASHRPGGAWLEVLSRESGKRRRLLRGGGMVVARFTPTGHLVYGDGDALFAVSMDLDRLEPRGVPVPVIDGIDHFFYHSNVALSDTGTVVYLPSEQVRRAELAWLDRAGRATPVTHGTSFEPYAFSLSPDGREAAIELIEGSGRGVWILDLERGSKRLLASEGGAPLFSRDGAFVTYWSGHGAEEPFLRRRADGTGGEERLFTHSFGWSAPADWSPDGRSLLFTAYSSRGDSDVWIHSGGRSSPLLASPFNEWSAAFSPDGRFVAFDVDEGGESNVFVQPFPGPGPRTPVSIGGGGSPRWRRSGRLVYTGSGNRVMAVAVETEPVLRVGRPQVLFESGVGWSSYDVTADGRFLVLSPRQIVAGPLELKVVLNWFEELERLAPRPGR